MKDADRFLYDTAGTDAQYRDSALNYRLRWRVYDLVELPIDVGDEVVSKLNLTGEESIVDIGCGDGQLLLDLRLRYNHRGKLVGVDKHPNMMFVPIERTSNEPRLNIEFIAGQAEQLEIGDDSADVVTSFFMLYHTDYDKALSEISRILKSDGTVVIATSGDFNKIRHRQFERQIARVLKTTPPRPMNEPFDTVKAIEVLPSYFNDVEVTNYRGNILLKTPEDISIYIESLMSMQSEFAPTPSITRFREAIELCVEPVIYREVNEFGSFRDFMDRSIFLCRQAV